MIRTCCNSSWHLVLDKDQHHTGNVCVFLRRTALASHHWCVTTGDSLVFLRSRAARPLRLTPTGPAFASLHKKLYWLCALRCTTSTGKCYCAHHRVLARHVTLNAHKTSGFMMLRHTSHAGETQWRSCSTVCFACFLRQESYPTTACTEKWSPNIPLNQQCSGKFSQLLFGSEILPGNRRFLRSRGAWVEHLYGIRLREMV